MLSYSVGDDSVYPNPLDDVSRAVCEVRENAGEWGINPDAIVLMGFSAGFGIAVGESVMGCLSPIIFHLRNVIYIYLTISIYVTWIIRVQRHIPLRLDYRLPFF